MIPSGDRCRAPELAVDIGATKTDVALAATDGTLHERRRLVLAHDGDIAAGPVSMLRTLPTGKDVAADGAGCAGSFALGYADKFFASANAAATHVSAMPYTTDLHMEPSGPDADGPLLGAAYVAWLGVAS